MNGKMYSTMHDVNEIIQHYFNNLERTQSRDEKEKEINDSIDDDERSYRCYHSDSEDSMDMENDDVYDFDCNDDMGIDS